MKLEFEWLEAPGVNDPAEAATWAGLRIELAGILVSQLHDERNRTVRPGFAGSALCLAEWFVEAWPRLIHERRVPIESTDEWWDWRGYHRFRAGRRGGAMPDLELVRFADDTVELKAYPDTGALAPGMAVRFLRSARARVPLPVVLREIERFLAAVQERLAGVDTPRAERFRARVANRTMGKADAAAGRLGLLDVSELAPLVGDFVDAPELDALVTLIEASSAPTLAARIDEARAAVRELPKPPSRDQRWSQLECDVVASMPAEEAWVTGWVAAQRFREAAGLAEAEPLRDDVLRQRCGWDARACLRTTVKLATGVDTVHVRAPGGPPAIVTTLTIPAAQTFRIARSLYHGLFGGVVPVAADSRLLGSRYSESNAFAAELLAPVERLKQLAPRTHVWEAEDLQSAGQALGVNPQVVLHQVQNRTGLGVLGLSV